MKEAGRRTRPGLLIRRTFRPDPDRAAAALAELLAAQLGEPASEPDGDSGIDGLYETRWEGGARLTRAHARQAIGHQQYHDRRPEPPDGRPRTPRPGRTPARQG